ncbi:MAG: transposase [Patescibacteria group bacterium]
MERKDLFEEEYEYHLFTRGVEKRIVFTSEADYQRFMLLLLLCNSEKSVRVADLITSSRGEPLRKALEIAKDRAPLVHILAYSLMPNHIHLIVHEMRKGGISKFMLKLMTAYSMYFNTKYARSGPLFTRPFRSRHINSDEYFRWVFAYVLLNPLELHQVDWKETGVRNRAEAAQYMQTYPYSSYQDYFAKDRPESRILEKSALPIELNEVQTMDDLLIALSENEVFAELPLE